MRITTLILGVEADGARAAEKSFAFGAKAQPPNSVFLSKYTMSAQIAQSYQWLIWYFSIATFADQQTIQSFY